MKKIFILLIFIQMFCSCVSNDTNITETPENSKYLFITSMYRNSNIKKSNRIWLLNADTGEVISMTTDRISDENNTQMIKNKKTSQWIRISPSNNSMQAINLISVGWPLGKNTIQDDNILINYYVNRSIMSDFLINDMFFITHINGINGFFIFNITKFNNEEEAFLFFNNNVCYKDEGVFILSEEGDGVLENVNIFEDMIYSIFYERHVKEIDTINAIRLIMENIKDVFDL